MFAGLSSGKRNLLCFSAFKTNILKLKLTATSFIYLITPKCFHSLMVMVTVNLVVLANDKVKV